MAPPSGSLEAGVEATLVALGLMWLGFGLAGLIPRWRQDAVTQWAFAFPALVCLAFLMMLAHIVTDGAIFRSPSVVRVVLAILAVALALRWCLGRSRDVRAPRVSRGEFVMGVGTSLFVAVLWAHPIFRMMPIGADGDAGLHAGWTEQLLNGEQTPAAPLTGDIPNYYPWLHHALLALLTHVTPGGRAFLALAPLQVLQPMGVAAALFGIGRLLAGRWGGVSVAMLAAATGGWGFLLVRELEVVNPRGAAATRYLGDLLFVRSYNVSFLNLSPPYPRDVALALLAGALLALVFALRSTRRSDYAAVGVLLGLAGLVQTDAFAVGLLTSVFVVMFAAAGHRRRAGLALFGPALLLFALWAVPIAVNYVRLGGFTHTTLVGPVVLPAWAILGGWGIITPLALVGAIVAARALDRPPVRVVAASFAAGAAALAGASLASAVLGGGFETVGRHHRYWPLFCLPLALLAGVGLHALVTTLGRRTRRGAWALAALIFLLAVPSPLIASLALPRSQDRTPSLAEALRGERWHALNGLSEYGSGSCNAAVPHPVRSFYYTGFRMLRYGDLRVRENAPRIRWTDIYRHISSEHQRLRDYELLISGSITREEFAAIVDRYDLDVIVVPAEGAGAEAFEGLVGQGLRFGDERVVLYGIDDC